MLDMLYKFKGKVRFELGTHINHPVEFWEESVDSLDKLKSVGFRIYNQNPLLKGVNDNFETLKRLSANPVGCMLLILLFASL